MRPKCSQDCEVYVLVQLLDCHVIGFENYKIATFRQISEVASRLAIDFPYYAPTPSDQARAPSAAAVDEIITLKGLDGVGVKEIKWITGVRARARAIEG
jgi:hypothetical protein